MLRIKNHLVKAYRRSRKMIGQITGTNYPLNRIPRRDLSQVIASNRRALAQIPIWLDPETMRQSIFNYGITSASLPRINQPADDHCTYADLIVYFLKHLRRP